jgi:hypothetical protein
LEERGHQIPKSNLQIPNKPRSSKHLKEPWIGSFEFEISDLIFEYWNLPQASFHILLMHPGTNPDQ